ncbi:MAG: hypothetical protein H7338_08340 [Candidatus Sericytochromatia bacterium]|nr:hypothetical protein [Candidatus Sericytochromatia bacterium]
MHALKVTAILCVASLTGCGIPPVATAPMSPSSLGILAETATETVAGPAKKGINEALGLTGKRQISDDSGIVLYISKPSAPGKVDNRLYVIYPGEGTPKQINRRNELRGQAVPEAEVIKGVDQEFYKSSSDVAAECVNEFESHFQSN